MYDTWFLRCLRVGWPGRQAADWSAFGEAGCPNDFARLGGIDEAFLAVPCI